MFSFNIKNIESFLADLLAGDPPGNCKLHVEIPYSNKQNMEEIWKMYFTNGFVLQVLIYESVFSERLSFVAVSAIFLLSP